MTQEEKESATVQALVLLQCYVHLHDVTVPGKGVTKKTKQLSNHLVEELERNEFKEVTSRLAKIGDDGMAYVKCIETVERFTEVLAKIPFQYWDTITDGIAELHGNLVEKGEITV